MEEQIELGDDKQIRRTNGNIQEYKIIKEYREAVGDISFTCRPDAFIKKHGVLYGLEIKKKDTAPQGFTGLDLKQFNRYLHLLIEHKFDTYLVYLHSDEPDFFYEAKVSDLNKKEVRALRKEWTDSEGKVIVVFPLSVFRKIEVNKDGTC